RRLQPPALPHRSPRAGRAATGSHGLGPRPRLTAPRACSRTCVRLRSSPVQRSFDDLGLPLCETTFCVVDVETTGGSAAAGAITEIGAVKLRGGECLGTLQTLVNPGMAIPPEIVVLTGITEAMVMPAPRMDEVLPSLLEFAGDAVIVGHNVRYDIVFLNASLPWPGRPRLSNQSVTRS